MEIEIRKADLQDLAALKIIEDACFPEIEAATLEALSKRLQLFPESFLVAEAEGVLVGFVNGAVIDEPIIRDAHYHDAALHNPDGAYQSVFGLDVSPAYRRQGIAETLLTALIDAARQAGRKGLTLCCKEEKIPYYEKFGLVNSGRSSSTHGNAVWYDMILHFEEERGEKMDPNIILVSQSPRRSELLSLSIKDFAVQAADIDEKAIEERILAEAGQGTFLDTAMELVKTLAREKAAVIHHGNREAMVIGSDTVVVLDEKILGKPVDEADAYAMLRAMAGKTHSVLTGVSILWGEKEVTFASETKVSFFEWEDRMEEEVKAYVASGKPMDKAGAYGIQEEAALWVSGIEGDYNTIVGLPIALVDKAIHRLLTEK
ncbi:Maf family nucleotide pyrophosphatase [Trichococcus collinsii]|uniref:dTTP/UTP pyrophosphatase n=1 Tax=Trichococcus collinsii TaxID=157076 RepID=A0AB37ZZJ2_9LACT|nr:Maf family nucleotide pyrophosphatase [Trichococcus collinsii]CZR06597.1 acyl-coa n-acyltransferase [Trichococcus collinsii]SEA31685.1 MAF protein [Trichococcus collinsii]